MNWSLPFEEKGSNPPTLRRRLLLVPPGFKARPVHESAEWEESPGSTAPGDQGHAVRLDQEPVGNSEKMIVRHALCAPKAPKGGLKVKSDGWLGPTLADHGQTMLGQAGGFKAGTAPRPQGKASLTESQPGSFSGTRFGQDLAFLAPWRFNCSPFAGPTPAWPKSLK